MTTLYETDRDLYDRLTGICHDRTTPAALRVAAMQAASYEMRISPIDLSAEAIRAALVDSMTDLIEDSDGPTPVLFHAFVDTARNGCRFPRWCRGLCAPDSLGDRCHIGIQHSVTDLEFGDQLVVETFRGENSDSTLDDAQVWFTCLGGDNGDLADVVMTPDEAHRFGADLFIAADRQQSAHELTYAVADTTFARGDRITVERVRQRTRRDGTRRPAGFEVTWWSPSQASPVKTALSQSSAWFLGRYLVIAADHADGLEVPIPDKAEDVAGWIG